jgi:hypothetical protein
MSFGINLYCNPYTPIDDVFCDKTQDSAASEHQWRYGGASTLSKKRFVEFEERVKSVLGECEEAEEIMKAINSRQWSIRNAIDYMKFVGGSA